MTTATTTAAKKTAPAAKKAPAKKAAPKPAAPKVEKVENQTVTAQKVDVPDDYIEAGGFFWSPEDVEALEHFAYLAGKQPSGLHELMSAGVSNFGPKLEISAEQVNALLQMHKVIQRSDANTIRGTRRRSIQTTRKIGESTEANAAAKLAALQQG